MDPLTRQSGDTGPPGVGRGGHASLSVLQTSSRPPLREPQAWSGLRDPGRGDSVQLAVGTGEAGASRGTPTNGPAVLTEREKGGKRGFKDPRGALAGLAQR